MQTFLAEMFSPSNSYFKEKSCWVSLSLGRTLLARVSSSVVFSLYVVVRVVADIRVVCLFYKSC